jgi:SagB-type dehydrogenase family enzyme
MKGLLFLVFFFLLVLRGEVKAQEIRISLPEIQRKGRISVEEAIFRRRSVRSFRDEALTLQELSQLCFAAQGITDEDYGFRTAPSAGALYPLKLYVVVGKVEGLTPGVYLYHPERHELTKAKEGDQRPALFRVALQQNSVREAPVVLVFTAIYERTTRKYGERGIRYVHMEIGHAAQNVYLQAESLDLGTVAIGAFLDNGVAEVLGLLKNEAPLYLMPVGKPKH